MPDTFLPPVLAVLGANITELQANLGIAKAEMRGVAAEAAKASEFGRKAMLGLAGGVAVVGVAAVKMASQFNSEMELIHTQAGASQREVDQLKAKVLDLAPAVGIGPEELAKGLYHVESAGFRGAQALDIEAAAAKGAAIGHADLEATTQAMIGTMAVGFKDVHNAADAMAYLNTTVGIGDMRMEKLAASISTGALPSFKSAGLGMKDYSAALATLTDNVTPADEAATRLRMTISLMAAPSGPAKAALSDIGLSSTALADDLRKPDGLLTAVMDLKHHLEAAGMSAAGQNQVIQRAFGGGRSSGAIMTLLEESDRLKSKYDALGDSEQRAAQFNEAWTATNQTLAQQGAEVRAWVQSTAIRIGNDLIPMVQHLLGESIDLARQLGQSLGPIIRGIGNDVRPVAHLVGDVLGGAFHVAGDAVKILGDHRAAVEGITVAVLGFLAASKGVALASAGYKALSSLLDTIRLKAMYAADGARELAAGENLARLSSLGVGAAAAGAGLVLGVLAVRHAQAQQAAEEHRQHVDALTQALQANSGAIDDNFRHQIAAQIQQSGVLAQLNSLGISTETYTRAVYGNADARRQVAQVVQDSLHTGRLDILAAGHLSTALKDQMQVVGEAKAAYQQQKVVLDATTASTQRHTTAVQANVTALDKAITAGKSLSDVLDVLAGRNLDAMSANLHFKDAISQLGQQLTQLDPKQRAQARALDESTDAGRAYKEQIIAAMQAAISHGEAVEKLTAKDHDQAAAERAGAAATEADIKALRAWALQHRVNKTELDKLTGALVTFADKAKTSGRNAGAAFGEGFAVGVDSKGARVSGSIADLAARAKALHQMLAIESPSKLTTYWGRMYGEGFAQGIESMYGRVQSAVRTMGSRTALDAATRSVMAKLKAVAETHGDPRPSATLARIGADNARLLALAGQREAVTKRLGDAQKRLADLVSARRDYVAQVAGSINDYGAITTAQPGSGYTELTTADVLGNLQNRLDAARKFAQEIAQLQRAGLNRTTLDQIVQAGVEQGGQIADALLAGGRAAVAQANSLEGQMARVAGALGNTAGSAMYDAGIRSAQGLVKGLQSQQAALTRMMQQLARAMVAELKRELGIRSPSQVMADEVGRWIPAGVAAGIAKHAHLAGDAAADLGGGVLPAGRWLGAGGGRGGGDRMTVVHNHYHIAGTVVAERELMHLVRGNVQRYVGRNQTTGFTGVRQ